MRAGQDMVLRNAGGLAQGDVAWQGGVICEASSEDSRVVDLRGLWLLPGIVDLHGDGFERHLAPRRGALADLSLGLAATEQELASNGITTAYLAQFWSWEGGMRGPDFAQRLAEALVEHRAALNLRLQLRVELCCAAQFPEITAFVRARGIDAVVINDHLPHKALDAGKRVPRLEGQALKAGRSPAAHQALLEDLYSGLPQARAAVPGFAQDLRAAGVRLGAHDTASPDEHAAARAMGLDLAEFPLTAETAAAAAFAGDAVVLGAPNVLRGGSHQRGGLAAQPVLEAGHAHALASDYHYPAPRLAAAKLIADGWSLENAWALVSSGPARIAGLADRGRIAPDLRADLLVTSPDLRRVHGTFVEGRLVYADAVLVERLLA